MQKLKKSRNVMQHGLRAAALVAAIAAVPVVKAVDSPNMTTWSISGSTAMRNFTISAGFSALEVGAPTLSLSNGTYTPGASGLQLAPSPYTGTALAGSTGAGVRMEWHEQGSVEGILELVNDQVGYAGGIGGTPLVDPTSRNPSAGNPIRVNRNNFTSATTLNGYTIANSAYNTYNPANYSLSGNNLLGGQNRVQMAISDVNGSQGFARGGTGTFSAVPGAAGYGKGNALLTATDVSGLGSAGGRQQLVDDDALNMKTTQIDPQTGANYGAGSWNTGGIANLTNKAVAVTATLMAANPGTGLTQLNKGDTQWLLTTGRLQNGAEFNVAQRDVNSGTRNVIANNAGVDPAWAVGENDDGNGNPGNPVGTFAEQASIGSKLRFSGKTSGGAQLRPTVQNNRMALGPLGLSDAISAVKDNASSTPLRALSYSNTATDTGASFVQANTSTITDGSYVIWQNETYVTVRTPDANYANENIAKGDVSGDVVKLRNNILTSVGAFPNPLSVNNAADQLLSNSFILPQMMLVSKVVDGGATSDVSGDVVNGKTHAQWRADLLADPTLPSKFNTTAAGNVTAGASSKYGVVSGTTGLAVGVIDVPITAQDASGNPTGSASAPKGNYLFGNFNQTGVRDFDAVKKAQSAQAALASVGTGAIDVNDVAVSNNTKIIGISAALDTMNGATGPSKGDLVVLGDYNGDGKFDGRDLYQMARGAAVSDATGPGFINGTLTATAANFGDKVRSSRLQKNAALDYMNGVATPAQKVAASANLANDPSGALAFNKVDVNRDGLLNLSDAKVLDYFCGKSYTNIGHQVVAVIGADGDSPTYTASTTFKPISLVDVELNDSATGKIDTFDFGVIRAALGSQLKDGDADFSGGIDFDDYVRIDAGFNGQGDPNFEPCWSSGDFDSNGVIDFDDFVLIDTSFNNGGLRRGLSAESGHFGITRDMTPAEVLGYHVNVFGPGYADAYNTYLASVPEPASAGVIGTLAAIGGTSRRRRR